MVTRSAVWRVGHSHWRIADTCPAATESGTNRVSECQAERTRQFERLGAVMKFTILSGKA